MNAMTAPPTNILQWYAVRMVPPGGGHRRSAKLGAEYESYRTTSGRMAKRRIAGSGTRVFVPEHILRRAGFDVFLPVKKVWQRCNRFKPEKQLVAYPLLADWMFVGWPIEQCRWSDLMALNVVAGVLGTGGRPVKVSPHMIQDLMRRWGGGVMPRTIRKEQHALASVQPGERLKIVEGPFEGFDASVVDVNGQGAKVMVLLFGRDTPVQMQLDHLAKNDRDAPAVKRPEPLPLQGVRYCPRCSGTMVAGHRNCHGHHVRCRDCAGVGALHSESASDALARWRVADRGNVGH